jgi:hypothetical protein
MAEVLSSNLSEPILILQKIIFKGYFLPMCRCLNRTRDGPDRGSYSRSDTNAKIKNPGNFLITGFYRLFNAKNPKTASSDTKTVSDETGMGTGRIPEKKDSLWVGGTVISGVEITVC